MLSKYTPPDYFFGDFAHWYVKALKSFSYYRLVYCKNSFDINDHIWEHILSVGFTIPCCYKSHRNENTSSEKINGIMGCKIAIKYTRHTST